MVASLDTSMFPDLEINGLGDYLLDAFAVDRTQVMQDSSHPDYSYPAGHYTVNMPYSQKVCSIQSFYRQILMEEFSQPKAKTSRSFTAQFQEIFISEFLGNDSISRITFVSGMRTAHFLQSSSR